MTIVYIVIGVLLLIIIFSIFVYNNLLKYRTLVEEAWSGIDVQLKRRYDVIPHLITAVKFYAAKEQEILENVTRLRSQAMDTSDLNEKIALEEQLSQGIKSILVTVEAYPDIKSNDNFINLQNQLVEIEDNIQLARRYYNGSVRNFNTKVQVFPNNILAGLFGFKTMAFFEAEENAKQDVKVKL